MLGKSSPINNTNIAKSQLAEGSVCHDFVNALKQAVVNSHMVHVFSYVQ